MAEALLSASHVIGETRIKALKENTLTLIQINATNSTNSLVKVCATRTPVDDCAFDLGILTLRNCSFREIHLGYLRL
jgi:hypothetical protein